MALETLLESQRQAAEILGVNFEELTEIQTPRLVMEDVITVGNLEMPVFRSHSGIAGRGLVGKGGIRMANFDNLESAVSTVKELSVEMLSKLAIRGFSDSYIGAKGLIAVGPDVDLRQMDLDTKIEIMKQYEFAMNRADLAGHKDVPAGDVNTNGLSDYYAVAYRETHGDDQYWQASITGKSKDMGGLEFRPAATGWGSFNSQLSLMAAQGQEVGRKAIMGLGNVAGWDAYFSSNNQNGNTPVMAVSDIGGTIWTDHPDGFKFTKKMVREVTDNPEFRGDKVIAIARMIEENQPGIIKGFRKSEDILSFDTDYFTPAALDNVITAETVQNLGAQLGVIEAANGPTTPEAHQYLISHGVEVVPDIIANGAGVDCSISEINANKSGSTPSTPSVREQLGATSQQAVNEMISTREQLSIKDPRVAATAMGIARLLADARPTLARELNLVPS